ncbi:ATPase family AAA domain-containing protein 5 isoform X1 [Pungitius pungitius]|uniref:ATPase family AAA domain-containing protein 5 isoform X1 n=1 Tax=Pungitius pungitius TaxID=134920 RepID=UPI002E0FE88D
MAGVVAMASAIEDFDTETCKKSRKDGGSHCVKTITNYFSPVPKPVEKPFSPPRSNNIADYFGRKAPSSKVKTSSPEPLKEKCETSEPSEKPSGAEAAVTRQSQKRRRKAGKVARKLVEAETFSFGEEPSCLIVEKPHDDRDLATEAMGSCGTHASDATAPVTQPSAEVCVTAIKNVGVDQVEEGGHKCGDGVQLNPELSGIGLSPIVPSKDKPKQVKTVTRNSRKAKHSEPEEKEKETSLCDVSMEVNVDEASRLNNSTVTISFEDFVHSQRQGSSDGEQDREDKSKADEIDTDQLHSPQAEQNVCSGLSPFYVSPRTITIQAEVHVISPKDQAAMVGGKVASIFNRKKRTSGPLLSSHLETVPSLSPPCHTVRRKSNVVLLEEDLELDELESDSVPKCKEEERKQFMAAFKQPGPEGAKTKPVKSQSKQRPPGEKAGDDADKVAEEDSVIPSSVEQVPAAAREDKAVKKKPARKGRKKAQDKESIATPPAAANVAEAVETVDEVEDEGEVVPGGSTSTPSIPRVRRSKREAAVRRAPELPPTSPVRKTRKRSGSKDSAAPPAAAVSPSNASPAVMSTPKIRKSKRTVFVAQLVCPPDTKESPIRIKFTKVHKNLSTTKHESGINTSLAAKATNESKKRKQAKKLVEKARVIQQSKKKAGMEQVNGRRSSRGELGKKSLHKDEDAVICLDDQLASGKRKTQKPLRSLNEVLGRASVGKETEAFPASEGASLGQDKAARKASAVISIFDDSSSEASQDDEQFRARKEFLKSGLPESFKKQMARTAASREAYSLSCASFQPVVHVEQPPPDCPLWSLLWPGSSLLCHLKEPCCPTSSSPPLVTGPLCVKTKPQRRAFPQRGSGWRAEISESVRQLLMEEVGTSNPPFPVQMFSTRLLKRRADHQQQHQSAASEAPTIVPGTVLLAEPVGGKRKRAEDEGGVPVKVAKKQRANRAAEEKSEPAKRGRTRRTRRSRPEDDEEEARPSVQTAAVPSDDDSVILIDSPSLENSGRKDVVREDVLWTDKYQPQHSSDIVGNTASVRRLHSWLKEWKLRADREERKKQKDKKHEEGSNDSDWDGGEEDLQDGEDMLCNTMLITGPTGIGKTAAVYACAQELGFKVFEVNASSQRSGRLILSQLKEATQSHQVDSQGVNAHKPSYFNSYGSSSSGGSLRLGSSPSTSRGKVYSPRRVVSSPRKPPQSPRGAKRGSLAPTSLANFFKMGQPISKETPISKKKEQTAASKKTMQTNECANKQKEPKEKSSEEQSKKTATSLILFEEVDVILDDDSGFLAAIKTFMTTTKRPVVLTSSDPAFSSMFDGNFEEILFKTPSVSDVGSFLRLLCLTEDMRTDPPDIGSLLRLNGCDIRQSLLQLQFWTRSAGGRRVTRALTPTGRHDTDLKPETADEASAADPLPPRDTGCTESMLGLLNVEPTGDIWERLRSPAEAMSCLELLSNGQRRGVDLLYSNLETLLPLPLTRLSTFRPEQSVPPLQQHPKEPPSHSSLRHTAESAECSEDSSPIKMSNRMRKSKKRHVSLHPDEPHSDSDSEDGFLSISKPRAAPRAENDRGETSVRPAAKRKPLTPEERLKSLPVSQCLQSIADFFDNMSYMDSSLMVHPAARDSLGRLPPVGALLKDGMTDEAREATDGWLCRDGAECIASEIPAAVEALSFHQCRVSVAAAWKNAGQLEGEARREAASELALPVAAHREASSFTQDGGCQPQLVRWRREVMESLALRGVFGTPANRSAAAVDYLPALRTICRSEQLKEQGKVKRRFLHYLDGIHLGLDKSTHQQLAEDFP